jgi:hypothetical protein
MKIMLITAKKARMERTEHGIRIVIRGDIKQLTKHNS